MHNDDSEWGAYAAACIRQIPALTREDVRTMRAEAVAEANATERVFTRRRGGRQLKWRWPADASQLRPPKVIHRNNVGWREKRDGTREMVWYYYGEGWLSADEHAELRRLYPRTAP